MANAFCKICNNTLKPTQKTTCGAKSCYNAWKLIRLANRPLKSKNCNYCKSEFQTKDSRNNFCSNDCRVSHRHKTMVSKYGKESITSPFSSRKPKLEKTMQERYNSISPKRLQFLKDRGFNNLSEFAKAINDFCTLNNIAPNSKICLDHFNMSTFMTRILHDEGFGDLFNNNNTRSTNELEIESFLTSLQINFNCNARPDFMEGKELDFYIPHKNLAIEFHGLVHHSERPVFYKKDISRIKSMHEQKYLLCKTNGIKLVQIFEDEWKDKPEIVKSMLKARLGLNSRIYARETELKQLTSSELKLFFNLNHISGSAPAITGFGLFYNDELVCALSVRQTWIKKYGENTLEIARFATKRGFSTVGGFSKLMKQVKKWANLNNYDRLLTFADCRFGSGAVYKSFGFTHLGKTKPNYFYEKQGKREDRFSHRKDKNLIETFGNSEREQNNNQGWYAIYDAGSEIYLLDLKK